MILHPSPDSSNKNYVPIEQLTEDEREACYQWFEQHMDQLPKSVRLGDGVMVNDVAFTVSNLIRQLRFVSWERTKIYRGPFALLRWIQEKCRAEMPDAAD